MADVSGRRRVRHIFASRKQKPAAPSSNLRVETDDVETTDELERDNSNAHAMSSSASDASSIMTTTVAIEGPLKKRLAKLPVMHDRYCVATFETNAQERSCVTLRSYKSRRAYYAQPEKPSSVHELQRIREWDGKTGFHRYAHAFTMETRDRKLFQCVAASASDKSKWLELLPRHAAFRRARDRRRNSMSTLGPAQRSEEEDKDAGGKARAASVDVAGPEELEGRGKFYVQDRLFRSASDALSDETTLEGSVRDRNEPLDWGLYGEGQESAAVSKYDVQETDDDDDDGNGGKSLGLLENELLDDREGERQTLDADAFLFGENGASRFGAVFVRSAKRDEDNDDEHNDDAEFVDEEMEARAAQKDKENQMKRRAQKLETNRDVYAEMAAARLAGMRKEARHPKKRSSHRQSRLSTSTDASGVEILDEEQSLVVAVKNGDVADLEEARQHCSSPLSLGSFDSREKSFVGSENPSSCGINGDVSGSDEEEAVENEAVPSSAVAMTQIIGSESAETGRTQVTTAETEERHQLKKELRADRRAKKRMMMREKEEEERMTLEAVELARAYREEQRAREEVNVHEEQTKRDKKERREMKETRKHEKGKTYQAELRKVADQKQAEDEVRDRERKAKKEKKKLKRKEKFTLPAERIHRRGERGAKRSEASFLAAEQAPAEAVNALVAVEDEAKKKSGQQMLEATAPALTPAPVSTSSHIQPEAFSMRQAVSTSTSLPASGVNSTYANGTVGVPALAGEGTGSAAGVVAMPAYHMSPPPFAPSYLHGPQSMPAYGLAATFGAYPPFYTAPYCYGRPVGLQPALMRPNMGFVAGLSAMNSFGTAAGPAPGPPTQNSSEPMIGPQLPTLEKCIAVSSADACAPFPLLSSAGNPVRSKLIDLPELPDVIEF